jgi:hypothetical protein
MCSELDDFAHLLIGQSSPLADKVRTNSPIDQSFQGFSYRGSVLKASHHVAEWKPLRTTLAELAQAIWDQSVSLFSSAPE